MSVDTKLHAPRHGKTYETANIFDIFAFGAAAVFVLPARSVAFPRTSPLVTGPLYGIAVYFVMSAVVSALSNVARQPRTLSGTLTVILIHIFFVGLPLAFITSRAERPSSA